VLDVVVEIYEPHFSIISKQLLLFLRLRG
jgi:hypothetical protein